jgi:hypothetical protein
MSAHVLQSLESISVAFANFMWSMPTVVLLVGGGCFFAVYSRFQPYCHFRHAIGILSGRYDEAHHDGHIPHFQALSTALSGTLGLGNVAGVGNASGFVEPLEATALHLIVTQCWSLIGALRDSGGSPSEVLKAIENRRYATVWDDVRDFLALHYRFNRRMDTPFWRYCRENTPLGGAEELVSAYAEAGPAVSLGSLIPTDSIFGYPGYINLLVGQRVPTRVRAQLSESESRHWQTHCQRVREAIKPALPVKEALLRAYEECRSWPKEGI